MSDATKITGMGSTPHAHGVAFRVWAPHAQSVSVIGSFNDWDGATHPMQAEENGYWYVDVAQASVGDHYRFLLSTSTGAFKRIDPYAREVTSSVRQRDRSRSELRLAGGRSAPSTAPTPTARTGRG